MPWECKLCATVVPEDSTQTCPSCEAAKSSWTMVQEETRTLVVVATKPIVLLRGVGHTPPSEGTEPEWRPTDRVLVLDGLTAQELSAAKKAPPPVHVLRARLSPRKGQDATLALEVLYEEDATEEREVEPRGAPDDEGRLDIRLVFVYGEGAQGVSFEGVEVVDITEGSGYAPKIELSALKKKPRSLEVSPCFLSLVARDDRGQPLAGWQYVVEFEQGESREGELGSGGEMRLEGLHQDRCTFKIVGCPPLDLPEVKASTQEEAEDSADAPAVDPDDVDDPHYDLDSWDEYEPDDGDDDDDALRDGDDERSDDERSDLEELGELLEIEELEALLE